jgi:hypothetical protein
MSAKKPSAILRDLISKLIQLEQSHAELLAALKIIAQHGRIDDSEARMNMVGHAIAKAEGWK